MFLKAVYCQPPQPKKKYLYQTDDSFYNPNINCLLNDVVSSQPNSDDEHKYKLCFQIAVK